MKALFGLVAILAAQLAAAADTYQQPVRELLICHLARISYDLKTAVPAWRGFYERQMQTRNRLLDDLDARKSDAGSTLANLHLATDAEHRLATEWKQRIEADIPPKLKPLSNLIAASQPTEDRLRIECDAAMDAPPRYGTAEIEMR